jgi:hypothetical protein
VISVAMISVIFSVPAGSWTSRSRKVTRTWRAMASGSGAWESGWESRVRLRWSV